MGASTTTCLRTVVGAVWLMVGPPRCRCHRCRWPPRSWRGHGSRTCRADRARHAHAGRVEAVDVAGAVGLLADEPAGLEHLEVLGHGRSAHGEPGGDLADHAGTVRRGTRGSLGGSRRRGHSTRLAGIRSPPRTVVRLTSWDVNPRTAGPELIERRTAAGAAVRTDDGDGVARLERAGDEQWRGRRRRRGDVAHVVVYDSPATSGGVTRTRPSSPRPLAAYHGPRRPARRASPPPANARPRHQRGGDPRRDEPHDRAAGVVRIGVEAGVAVIIDVGRVAPPDDSAV